MPWHEYSTTTQGGSLPYVTIHLWHGSQRVNIVALVDSGADDSLMDASYADLLGLDRSEAVVSSVVTATGATETVLRWPNRPLEMQFETDRFPFLGAFIEFPAGSDPGNIVGRSDFFQRYIVQFWDAAEMMNIDTSPDFPRPAP
jgi:hypothetical protein